MMDPVTPYCGTAPLPGALAARWNLDPVLIAILAAFGLAYALGAGRARLGVGERAAFAAGFGVTVLALVSPLCPLSVALFAARVGQHMLIALVGAPLVVLGRPGAALRALLPARADPAAPEIGPVTAGLLFAVALWLWHMPVPYSATFRSDCVYWLMHVSLLASACLLWHSLLTRENGALVGLTVGIGTSIQMGFLGAILTLAGRPLFPDHRVSAPPWGLSALADQQLGGVLMWVPGCSVFVLAACLTLVRLMRDPYAFQSLETDRSTFCSVDGASAVSRTRPVLLG
ncbi:cytochrome c oxidase assembly protein [Methylobacterium sp. DB1607]|nr:cytochrome c oxidase assembly protein [Methylobacterium sp. DB1607]